MTLHISLPYLKKYSTCAFCNNNFISKWVRCIPTRKRETYSFFCWYWLRCAAPSQITILFIFTSLVHKWRWVFLFFYLWLSLQIFFFRFKIQTNHESGIHFLFYKHEVLHFLLFMLNDFMILVFVVSRFLKRIHKCSLVRFTYCLLL